MSRGINRFLGLAMVLSHVHDTYKEISQIGNFSSWTKEAARLSNESVKAAWEENGCEIFRKALACGWFCGAHRFYAQQKILGTLYLLLFWTRFSFAMTLIDLMIVVPMKADSQGMIEL